MSEDGLDRDELLKDSEATLREVAGILMELRDQEPRSSDGLAADGSKGMDAGSPTRLGELLGILTKAASEVNKVLEEIRRGREETRHQDSSDQQFIHISGVLAEAQEKLDGLARFFDLHGMDGKAGVAEPLPGSHPGPNRISYEAEGP